jgi:SAM-dependent methyltransferase
MRTKTTLSNISFPEEWSGDNYLLMNPDLTGVNLATHFEEFGFRENRQGQFVLTRFALKTYLPKNVKYLEIGPLGRPYLTLNEFNVKYFDVIEKEALKEIAKNAPGHNPADVPIIDYVDPNGDLKIINEKFDIVFSSHSIEHQPNILGHLEQVSNLLKSNGLYICIIPDHRYCFDHFQNPSTIFDVIEAYVENRNVHTRKNLLTHQYLSAHNDPVEHWAGNHGAHHLQEIDFQKAVKAFKKSTNDYEDCHGWFFTPHRFREIFKSSITKVIALELERCYETPKNAHEFLTVFRKA